MRERERKKRIKERRRKKNEKSDRIEGVGREKEYEKRE